MTVRKGRSKVPLSLTVSTRSLSRLCRSPVVYAPWRLSAREKPFRTPGAAVNNRIRWHTTAGSTRAVETIQRPTPRPPMWRRVDRLADSPRGGADFHPAPLFCLVAPLPPPEGETPSPPSDSPSAGASPLAPGRRAVHAVPGVGGLVCRCGLGWRGVVGCGDGVGVGVGCRGCGFPPPPLAALAAAWRLRLSPCCGQVATEPPSRCPSAPHRGALESARLSDSEPSPYPVERPIELVDLRRPAHLGSQYAEQLAARPYRAAASAAQDECGDRETGESHDPQASPSGSVVGEDGHLPFVPTQVQGEVELDG